MIYNNVVLTANPEEDVNEIAQHLEMLATLSLAEPGCHGFKVFHSTAEPRVFLLIEAWESDAHLAAHRQAAAFTEVYEPHVLPRVERVVHPSVLVAGA